MGDHVGIIRSEDGMAEGITKLTAWRAEVAKVKAHGSSQYNAGWHEALDLQSLAIISEAITRAAKMRQESRGAHTRTDFGTEDYDVWGNRNIIVYKDDAGAMQVEAVERETPDPFLEKIARASVEELDAMIASGEVEV